MIQRVGSLCMVVGRRQGKDVCFSFGGVQQIRKRESIEILSQDLSGSCYHNYALSYFFQMFLWSFSTYCILASLLCCTKSLKAFTAWSICSCTFIWNGLRRRQRNSGSGFICLYLWVWWLAGGTLFIPEWWHRTGIRSQKFIFQYCPSVSGWTWNNLFVAHILPF